LADVTLLFLMLLMHVYLDLILKTALEFPRRDFLRAENFGFALKVTLVAPPIFALRVKRDPKRGR
jgi:hypothetical protein